MNHKKTNVAVIGDHRCGKTTAINYINQVNSKENFTLTELAPEEFHSYELNELKEDFSVLLFCFDPQNLRSRNIIKMFLSSDKLLLCKSAIVICCLKRDRVPIRKSDRSNIDSPPIHSSRSSFSVSHQISHFFKNIFSWRHHLSPKKEPDSSKNNKDQRHNSREAKTPKIDELPESIYVYIAESMDLMQAHQCCYVSKTWYSRFGNNQTWKFITSKYLAQVFGDNSQAQKDELEKIETNSKYDNFDNNNNNNNNNNNKILLEENQVEQESKQKQKCYDLRFRVLQWLPDFISFDVEQMNRSSNFKLRIYQYFECSVAQDYNLAPLRGVTLIPDFRDIMGELADIAAQQEVV